MKEKNNKDIQKKEAIKKESKLKNYIKAKGLKNVILSAIIIVLIAISSLALAFALYVIISAPNFDTDKLYTKEASVLYDVHGVEFARIGQENRDLIQYNDLPQVFVDCLVATEDSRFFQHNGVDLARFVKAVFYQLIGKNYGGASTLSMQLIKKTYTSDNAKGIEGIIRKFTDIYMAVFKLENIYTKDQIIEFYANSMWFGNDGNINYTGIYGVEQASQYYFGKSIRELTLAETSLLVGMYQNPVTRNPYKYPENARARQKIVLQLMVNHGYITAEEMNRVLDIPVQSLLADQGESTSSNAYQAIIDYVLNEVEDKTGKNPYNNSMKIYTTIDLDKQNVLTKLETGESYKWPYEELQMGIAVTSVKDGSIVALSGGRNYKAKGLNRATDIRRQPGSTAKPFFDYGPYFEFLNGSTGDYFFDEEYKYTNGHSIKNWDNKYNGMMTARAALSASRNIPALQAFQKVAEKDQKLIEDFAHSFGINYGKYLVEAASIGGFDGVSPLQESAAYAVFGRGGYYIEPYIFTKVVFEDDTEYNYKYTKEQVVSAQTAYMINSILREVVSTGGCGGMTISGTQIACKTGTTNIEADVVKQSNLKKGSIRDAWNTSYTSEFSISIWLGYDITDSEHCITQAEIGNVRNPLMNKAARGIYSKNQTFKRPGGVVSVEVEKNTIPLQKPSANTPAEMRMTELFKEGTEPTEVSIRYKTLDDVTNLKYTSSGNVVSITWDDIPTPKAIDPVYLQQYFNDNYGSFAAKYYEKRLQENAEQFGSLGYEVYLKDNDSNLTSLGWITNNRFQQTIEYNKNYTFVIKSSYSIFKGNQSNGSSIKINIASSIPEEPTTPVEPNTPNEDDTNEH